MSDGVFTRANFLNDAVVCNYHGRLMSRKSGRFVQESGNSVYRYLFKHDSKTYMIDAKTNPCDCHSHMQSTFGRKINHSRVKQNIQGHQYSYVDDKGKRRITILFKATRNITYGEQLFYDYYISAANDGLQLA